MAKKQTVPDLVPPEEQPYPIPANWRWVRLSCAVHTTREKTEDFSDSSTVYIGLEHMENGVGIVNYGTVAEVKSLKNVFHCGQILYGKLRPYLNKHDIASCDGVCSTDILVFETNESALTRYVNYFFDDCDFLEYVVSRSRGINLPRVSEDIVLKKAFPLPPISEQHRIVDRIESLFAMLDEARDKAQAVVDGYELRRAAILHKAFTGELTAKWREEHNISLNSWRKVQLSDVATLQTGLMKGKHYNDGEITKFMPYLRVANVQDGFLNLDEIKQIEVPKALIGRYLLKDGDVLFTEGGDYDKLGRGTVWRGEIKDCLHQNHVFAVRTNATVLIPTFLSYQAGSLYGRRYFLSCSKQTVNLASINSTQLKKFPVILPSKEEQIEIVRIIDTTLLQEQQTRASAEKVLTTIDMMKKKILGLAFRGLLGTNDPAEPCAETGGNIGCP